MGFNAVCFDRLLLAGGVAALIYLGKVGRDGLNVLKDATQLLMPFENLQRLQPLKVEAKIVIITLYVDDLIIRGDALKDVEHVKALLRKQFDMKNWGELRYFLGIEMIRNEGGIWLSSQKKYGLDMLMKYGMADCKPISTPLDHNLKLRIDEGEVLVLQCIAR
ncbi:hypothetical protein L7F22_037570 [Adiantum nelumboides]|nr:hypothetical protein [Adiantum nelumboides]